MEGIAVDLGGKGGGGIWREKEGNKQGCIALGRPPVARHSLSNCTVHPSLSVTT